MRWLFLACLLGVRLGATTLGEFSCQRPPGVDEGTWHNVSVAVSLVNGTVLGPGQEFSFLKTVAPGSGHWRPGNTLYEGALMKSLGGGYCQVSTAIYNAALLAGFPVTQRYNHSFYDAGDAYVAPGRDAAVSGSNHADFCFINSSHAPLTIEAEAVEGSVQIRLLGQGMARKRWILTDAERIPMRHLKAASPEAQRKGYDGWVVTRSLCILDSKGTTRTVKLDTDRYQMISQYE
jgi:vancomycin resistance protein YoaR